MSLEWAAGFFEGEGCVFSDGRSLTMTISQVDPVPLGRFREIMGSGGIYGPRDRGRSSKQQPIYTYSNSGSEKVEAAYAKLKPFLSPRRIAQFEKAIARRKQWLEESKQRRAIKAEATRMRRAEKLALQHKARAEARLLRQDFCKRGHQQVNPYRYVKGDRTYTICRECVRLKNEARRARDRGMSVADYRLSVLNSDP